MRATREKKQELTDTRKRILVVEDHPLVREGIALLVNREKDLEICGEASDAAEAMQAIRTGHPDLILMDISIRGSNGIELTKTIRKRYPHLPVLMLSMHDEMLYAERALKAGARGYLMKQEAPEVVLKAIRWVLRGEVYVSSAVSSRVVADLADGSRQHGNRTGIERLSDRELEVFDLIGRGLSTKDMAEKLCVSPKTIEAHRSHIKQKLDVPKSAQLYHKAIRWVESNGSM